MYAGGVYPLFTIRSIKTRIGTESLIQVPIKNSNESMAYGMTELTALFLKTLKLSMQSQIKMDEIVDLTITIPAAFNSDERNATLEASRLAGFKNAHILDEPTAVLLNYLNASRSVEVLDLTEPKKILVYDIGGGTLDISVAEVVDNEGDFDVSILGRSPRMDFGGDDIDKYIAAYFLSEFERINPTIDTRSLGDQAKIFSRMVSRAEEYKIELNAKMIQHLSNERRRNRIKQRVNFEVIDELCITDLILTDEILKEVLFDVIGKEGKLVAPLKSVLVYSKLLRSDIDLVILTGGSSKFYLVKETIDKFFEGRAEILEYTEASAVSKGAAIHSYNQTEEGLRKLNLDDLMVDDIYVKKEHGFDKIIPAQTSPESEGEYEYQFENISNRIELFLYYGVENEDAYKYKEIAGVFKDLDDFYRKGQSLTLTWKFDGNKIAHMYYKDELLVNTQQQEVTYSSLIGRL